MSSAALTDSTLSSPQPPRKWRLRLLFWATLVSLLVGVTGLAFPLEDVLRDLRGVARSHPTSGQVVVVGVDDRSLVGQLQKWPWPRRYYGDMVENLRRAGAKEIFFDLDFSPPTGKEDTLFAKALARPGAPVTLAGRVVVDGLSDKSSDLLPTPVLRRNVEVATINVQYNFRGEVRKLPYQQRIGAHSYQSLAAKLAKAPEGMQGTFPIDFALDPHSVPTLSAIDAIKGNFEPSQVAGKSVIIGTTSWQLGDTYLVPGHGILPGIYLQTLGAETLLEATPRTLGWLIPALLAILLSAALVTLKDIRIGATAGGIAIAAVFPAAIVLESHHIFGEFLPALTALCIVSGALGWVVLKQFYRSRGSINSISGLPNLNVLRQAESGKAHALVVAKVHNYAEIASALSPEGEAMLVQQIARRLALISSASKLYQSDEGIFAWLADLDETAPGEHLTALYGILRNPMLVLDSQVDVTVTFGIDNRRNQPLASRLGSALVAADEALREGLKWKSYDPAQQEDITWKLSLLSQLDRAIELGDLWIAFQPKLDVESRKIIGAEALARWNHPEKGPISPLDFILAAEQSGRIGKLTDYVLTRSIEAAARLNRKGLSFNVAVNLSARLIDGVALHATISRLLGEHRLPAECLTLEITETAALAGAGRDLEILKELREMGVKLSIDDYGTGLSTLDYMKRIPATEIKIDKSFIQAIEKSRSDRLMVHSTIQLAHSLGQKVVAEGVERAETLEALAQMGCDIAQGYLIGRPLPLKELEKCLIEQRRAA